MNGPSRASAAVVALVLVATPAAAQTTDDPDELLGPVDAPDDVVDDWILPLEPAIQPMVVSIEEVGAGIRRTKDGIERLVTLDADVFFAFDSAAVTPEARTVLEGLADELVGTVTVVGHTDAIGSDAFNDDLSLRRAQAVVSVLAELAPDVALVAEGRGEREPVAPNETEDGEDFPEGRALNRRVELRYADDGG